jgi:hypothetical protein
VKVSVTLPGLDLTPSPTPIRIVRSTRKPQSAAGRTRKGKRIEVEITALHEALGIKAIRQPLSGALAKKLGPAYAGDLKLWIYGNDNEPAVAEVKGRGSGAGFTTLEKWLGAHDVLVLKRNGAKPMIVLTWSAWARLVGRSA